jgi:hypothetical protein
MSRNSMFEASSQCDAARMGRVRRSSLFWLAGAWAAFSLLLACDGCQERGPEQVAETPHASPLLSEPSDGGAERIAPGREERHLAIITHLLPLAGKIDTANRYRSAVRIRVAFRSSRNWKYVVECSSAGTSC